MAKAKKVKITLPRARGSEPKELYVAINGVEFLIPKGVSVEVPDYVAEEIARSDAAEIHRDAETARMLAATQKPTNM